MEDAGGSSEAEGSHSAAAAAEASAAALAGSAIGSTRRHWGGGTAFLLSPAHALPRCCTPRNALEVREGARPRKLLSALKRCLQPLEGGVGPFCHPVGGSSPAPAAMAAVAAGSTTDIHLHAAMAGAALRLGNAAAACEIAGGLLSSAGAGASPSLYHHAVVTLMAQRLALSPLVPTAARAFFAAYCLASSPSPPSLHVPALVSVWSECAGWGGALAGAGVGAAGSGSGGECSESAMQLPACPPRLHLFKRTALSTLLWALGNCAQAAAPLPQAARTTPIVRAVLADHGASLMFAALGGGTPSAVPDTLPAPANASLSYLFQVQAVSGCSAVGGAGYTLPPSFYHALTLAAAGACEGEECSAGSSSELAGIEAGREDSSPCSSGTGTTLFPLAPAPSSSPSALLCLSVLEEASELCLASGRLLLGQGTPSTLLQRGRVEALDGLFTALTTWGVHAAAAWASEAQGDWDAARRAEGRMGDMSAAAVSASFAPLQHSAGPPHPSLLAEPQDRWSRLCSWRALVRCSSALQGASTEASLALFPALSAAAQSAIVLPMADTPFIQYALQQEAVRRMVMGLMASVGVGAVLLVRLRVESRSELEGLEARLHAELQEAVQLVRACAAQESALASCSTTSGGGGGDVAEVEDAAAGAGEAASPAAASPARALEASLRIAALLSAACALHRLPPTYACSRDQRMARSTAFDTQLEGVLQAFGVVCGSAEDDATPPLPLYASTLASSFITTAALCIMSARSLPATSIPTTLSLLRLAPNPPFLPSRAKQLAAAVLWWDSLTFTSSAPPLAEILGISPAKTSAALAAAWEGMEGSLEFDFGPVLESCGAAATFKEYLSSSAVPALPPPGKQRTRPFNAPPAHSAEAAPSSLSPALHGILVAYGGEEEVEASEALWALAGVFSSSTLPTLPTPAPTLLGGSKAPAASGSGQASLTLKAAVSFLSRKEPPSPQYSSLPSACLSAQMELLRAGAVLGGRLWRLFARIDPVPGRPVCPRYSCLTPKASHA